MKTREIKFRGLTNNGDWVYGTYHYSADQKHHYILKREKFIEQRAYSELHKEEVTSVISDSVSQYTGLKDKNGKEIYEGDIINHGNGRHLCQVVFEEGCFCMRYFKGLDAGITRRIGFSAKYCEIIGNIYENKSLLGM